MLGDGEWRTVWLAFVEPTDHIRFGDRRMTGAALAALCPRHGGRAAGDEHSRPSRPAVDDGPDPSRGLVRDPETDKVLEQEPPRGRRRGTGR